MSEEWRTLRVGDRIRFVSAPPEWNAPGYRVPRSTRQVFRRLMDRDRPVRIFKIDPWGVPWFACRFRSPSGGWECHDIGIVEGGWVRVGAARISARSQSDAP